MCTIQQIAHVIVSNFGFFDSGKLVRMPNPDGYAEAHAVLRFDGWGSFAEYAIASDSVACVTTKARAILNLSDMLHCSAEAWMQKGELPKDFEPENFIVLDAFGNLHLLGEWDETWTPDREDTSNDKH